MGAVSTAAAQALLKGAIGDERISAAPATLYIGVSSTLPILNVDGTISGATEPTTGGYARIAVANTDAQWTFTGRSASNTAALEFPEATADWDEVVEYFVVYSAATAGTALWFGSLNKAFTIFEGVKLVLASGAVTVTIAEE